MATPVGATLAVDTVDLRNTLLFSDASCPERGHPVAQTTGSPGHTVTVNLKDSGSGPGMTRC